MLRLLRRLNDLPIFDPSRWPAREALARILGSLAVGLFLFRRILQFAQFPGFISELRWLWPWMAKFSGLPRFFAPQPFDLEFEYARYGVIRFDILLLWWGRFLIWAIESGILIGYIIAFVTRDRSRSVAIGFMQTVFPLLVAALPFAIVMTPYTWHLWFPLYSRTHVVGLYSLDLVLIAAGTFNLVGLFTLRRSFTIMTEARTFIQGGVYSVVRHPLYASHFLIFLCYTILHFHPATIAIYVALVAGLIVRAQIEERKLAAAFPEYEEYRQKTGMFFPKLF